MSTLSPKLRSFLLRHLSDMHYRKFLIHTLTRSVKQSMVLRDELISRLLKESEPIEIDLRGSLSEPVKPDLQNLLSDEDVNRLGQANKWIYDNNIPMILENKNILKLLLSFQNFTSFSEEDQAKSDEFSKSARGCTNFEYYQYVVDHYLNQSFFEIIELFDEKGKSYIADLTARVEQIRDGKVDLTILSDNPGQRLMTEVDQVNLNKGDIVNVHEKMTTTVGRIITNQIGLVDPFGDIFPYQNAPIMLGAKLDTINKALSNKTIDTESFQKSMDGFFYLGHFNELCTPCLNERALTTDPNIKKRKAELLKQYEGKLDDPTVIAKIEDELIAMDKEYMKGDTSLRFYTPLGGAAFDLWRKKLYIAVGGIEAFSKDSSKYNFLRNSLEEGVRVEDLNIYGNESRKGSYQRGHETQKGGYLTKEVVRAFHDTAITHTDCGTKRGVKVDFSIIDPKKFIGRYILLQGKWFEITDQNVNSIPRKIVTMRSPMYCQGTDGFCYKCVGKFFENLKVRQISMSIVDITTTFMLAAMKNMHGSKLAITEVKSLDHFIM